MYNRHIRHLVTELGNRLSDKEFLKKIGLSRRSMQQLFDKDRWEVIFEKAFPVTRRFSCAEILEFCRKDMEKLISFMSRCCFCQSFSPVTKEYHSASNGKNILRHSKKGFEIHCMKILSSSTFS